MAGQSPGDCEYGSFWHEGENNPADCEYGYFAHIGGVAAPPPEQQIHTKVADSWGDIHTVWYKSAGAWGKIKVYTKVAGVWIELYDGT